MSRIAILGAGAWGTALALALSRHQPAHQVTLWVHTPAHAELMLRHGENRSFLAGFALPASLRITSGLAEAAEGAEVVLSVVPSAHTRVHMEALAPSLTAGQVLISASKGLEHETHLRMTEVIEQVCAAQGLTLAVGTLSGPSFAQEVAADLPAALTLAFADLAQAAHWQSELSTPTLRLYRNDDVVGVELGGALKNVIALAAGAVVGAGLGHNATAALLTRGIAEITRLALACGGRRETLAGLSGFGDLVLTSTGKLSRNRWVGEELGRGLPLPEILADLNGKVAEGVRTTYAALSLAASHGVDMPITQEVAALLSGERSARDAMRALMGRAHTGE